MNKFTLLYVEDDVEILENVKYLFSKSFKEIYTAKDGEEGLAAYHEYKPDIILSDINMPKLDGLSLVNKIREDDKDIPIVLISAYSDRDKLLQAIEIGVSSYVVKPFTIDELEETIAKVIEKKKIQNQAITDSLTLLHDRTKFPEIMDNSIHLAKRYDTYLTYIMLDIDHFKEYNDTYGHLKGDEALKDVANCLMKYTNRTDDYAFRIGGEEFVLLVLGLDKEKSINYANKIREAILSLNIEHSKNSANKFLSVSMGIYMAKGKDIVNKEQIYHLSDKALYKSKEDGRNMLTIFKENER